MSEATGSDADHRAVRDVSDRFLAAEMAGDVEAFLALLSEDSVIMAPGMPPLEGLEQCAAFIRRQLPELHAAFAREITLDTRELRIIGDWAMEVGIMSQTVTPRAGGRPYRERYNVLFVFSRDVSGAWKGARTIFNTIDSDEDDDR